MKKDTILQIRLSESQKKFYQDKAGDLGLSMSEFFKLQNLMFFRLRDFEPDIFDNLINDLKKDIDRI